MKTRNAVMTALTAAGVLGAGYALGTTNGQTLEATSSSSTTSAESSSSTIPTTETSTSSSAPETTEVTGATGTFTGTAATHKYGTVTVTVTMNDGVITEANASYTVKEQKSTKYNESAIPTLNSEVVAANSADVSTVSGSTYTSEAYLTSLQSALDQANS